MLLQLELGKEEFAQGGGGKREVLGRGIGVVGSFDYGRGDRRDGTVRGFGVGIFDEASSPKARTTTLSEQMEHPRRAGEEQWRPPS